MSRDKLEAEEELVKQLEEKVKAAEACVNLDCESEVEKVSKEEENGVTTSSSSTGLILDKDAKLVGKSLTIFLVGANLRIDFFGVTKFAN